MIRLFVDALVLVIFAALGIYVAHQCHEVTRDMLFGLLMFAAFIHGGGSYHAFMVYCLENPESEPNQ